MLVSREVRHLISHPNMPDIHYNGIPAKIMNERFRGEVAYNGEVDVHFPHLTVGQTLSFSTRFRIPHQRIDNMPREKVVKEVPNILGAVFGLRHTFNTKVGVCAQSRLVDSRMILFAESVEESENVFPSQRLYVY